MAGWNHLTSRTMKTLFTLAKVHHMTDDHLTSRTIPLVPCRSSSGSSSRRTTQPPTQEPKELSRLGNMKTSERSWGNEEPVIWKQVWFGLEKNKSEKLDQTCGNMLGLVWFGLTCGNRRARRNPSLGFTAAALAKPRPTGARWVWITLMYVWYLRC